MAKKHEDVEYNMHLFVLYFDKYVGQASHYRFICDLHLK